MEEIKKFTELKDTITLMCSDDYVDRFIAEYIQVKIRYEKLRAMIVKYEAGTLNFIPNCDIELLQSQLDAMDTYLYCLEVRAQVEDIDLNAFK